MPEFHPEAIKSLEAKAESILREARVQASPAPKPPMSHDNPIHPVFNVSKEHIVGTPTFFRKQVDGYGTENGRFWDVNGQLVGWDGAAYRSAVQLAGRFAKEKIVRGTISDRFVLEELFAWLRQKLEGKTTETFYERITARCKSEIQDHEIWVPLYRTYARSSRTFGPVILRPISKEIMDAWYSRFIPANEAVAFVSNRERSKLQGTLAACTSIKAERIEAEDIAFDRAIQACALLRFLSPANWSAKVRSYVVPLGMERVEGKELIRIKSGLIESTYSGCIDRGPSAWNLDEHVHHLPHLIEPLGSLLSHHKDSTFRQRIYEALLVYSKNSLANEASDKLVFVLVALESILLKSSSEPILGNLGERLAFLIGETLDARKTIVTVTREIYGLRSKFIHHGEGIEDNELLDQFLWFAWEAFAKLLQMVDEVKSIEELLRFLDDRRLA